MPPGVDAVHHLAYTMQPTGHKGMAQVFWFALGGVVEVISQVLLYSLNWRWSFEADPSILYSARTCIKANPTDHLFRPLPGQAGVAPRGES